MSIAGAVVGRDLGRSIALVPVVRRVAHDGQEPRTSAAAVERANVLQRTYACVLYDVLCIVDIARWPPRQVASGIEVRQDQRLETSVIRQVPASCFAA